jgi:hypothetical protein
MLLFFWSFAFIRLEQLNISVEHASQKPARKTRIKDAYTRIINKHLSRLWADALDWLSEFGGISAGSIQVSIFQIENDGWEKRKDLCWGCGSRH